MFQKWASLFSVLKSFWCSSLREYGFSSCFTLHTKTPDCLLDISGKLFCIHIHSGCNSFPSCCGHHAVFPTTHLFSQRIWFYISAHLVTSPLLQDDVNLRLADKTDAQFLHLLSTANTAAGEIIRGALATSPAVLPTLTHDDILIAFFIALSSSCLSLGGPSSSSLLISLLDSMVDLISSALVLAE